MIRAISKWFISRSLDHPVRLPRWVRRSVDRDDELRRFESLARQLGSRLKRDAPAWSVAQAAQLTDEASASQRSPSTPASPAIVPRRIAWSLAAGALAAGLVFVFANLPNRADRLDRPSPSGDSRPVAIAQDATSAMHERQWLVTVWQTGRAGLNQLKAGSLALRNQLEVPHLPDSLTIGAPARFAGSIAGRMAATLDSGIQLQRQRLTSDLQSAFSFFTHHLPATAAKLVGLHSDQRT